eukprot:INCI16270.5.p1 GENE.INCI16270.5~~INCI16270.5.p1  ORF type:complete len:419 (-),score=49.02 INCI16270.5:939-2195(-)
MIERFYIYSGQRISKSFVEDPAFRNMLKAVGEVPETHVDELTRKSPTSLVSGVNKEYQDWRVAFKRFVELSMERSKGNPFAQGIHDCVTLKSGKKFLAVGIRCVDPWLHSSHTITLGFLPIESSRADNVTLAVDAFCLDLTGYKYSQIVHTTVADYAALQVADDFDLDREGRAMHNGDKIALYAFGDLQHSRGGGPADRFEEGQRLMKNVKQCAVHFSYGSRRAQLRSHGKRVAGGCPNILPTTDLSTSRVAARHNMVVSVLRLNRGLQRYAKAVNPGWKMGHDEWATLAEMEGVVKTITDVTTIAQSEKAQMGAMGHLARLRLMERLRGGHVSVYRWQAITSCQTPKYLKPVAEFTAVGRKFLDRARMEAERRLCGRPLQNLKTHPSCALSGKCCVRFLILGPTICSVGNNGQGRRF